MELVPLVKVESCGVGAIGCDADFKRPYVQFRSAVSISVRMIQRPCTTRSWPHSPRDSLFGSDSEAAIST